MNINYLWVIVITMLIIYLIHCCSFWHKRFLEQEESWRQYRIFTDSEIKIMEEIMREMEANK